MIYEEVRYIKDFFLELININNICFFHSFAMIL